VYIDVDPEKTDNPLLLIINTANQQEFNRKWSIRIRQIPCKSRYRAPTGCLQYYTGVNGNVESFNYRTTTLPVTTTTPIPNGFQQPQVPVQNAITNIIAANYLNNLNYGVCIARAPNCCAIKWSAIEFDFGAVQTLSAPTPASQCVQGNGNLNIDDDFLVVPFGTDRVRSTYVDRYCGQKFSSSQQGSDSNDDVYSFNSPYALYVHTDNKATNDDTRVQNQRGFLLKYEQVPC